MCCSRDNTKVVEKRCTGSWDMGGSTVARHAHRTTSWRTNGDIRYTQLDEWRSKLFVNQSLLPDELCVIAWPADFRRQHTFVLTWKCTKIDEGRCHLQQKKTSNIVTMAKRVTQVLKNQYLNHDKLLAKCTKEFGTDIELKVGFWRRILVITRLIIRQEKSEIGKKKANRQSFLYCRLRGCWPMQVGPMAS